MHELSVTQGILSTVVEVAQQNGGGRIFAIDLVIGELSSIVDDSVQFYFDFLSKDTLAEGATLNFRREAATATCLDCWRQTAVTPPLLPACPACGSARLRVTGGKEFYVESIEVDDEDTGR
jgi:hydrogenase nickel incorporation protein HypA/HybF